MKQNKREKEGIGLCLSGGGFRATLFHVGSLWRLNELGLLKSVRRISGVSGGSIASGLLALQWDVLEDAGWAEDAFCDLVVSPLRRFCEGDVDAQVIGTALLPWIDTGEALVDAYRQHLYGNASLRDLPDEPRFVFNATNLQTGRLVRISKPYIADWTLGLLRDPDLPLATAVAASSAFPPFLSPVVFDSPGVFEAAQGSVHHGDPAFTARLQLTDGGVYDNLGLETVLKSNRAILVSDAGAPFKLGLQAETDWIRQVLRSLDIATDQARALRKRWLVDHFKLAQGDGRRDSAYWGIDTCIGDYPLADPLPADADLIAALPRIRTRLNRFSPEEQGRLINWGYALCDVALRGRAPDLVPGASRPTRWPISETPLGPI